MPKPRESEVNFDDIDLSGEKAELYYAMSPSGFKVPLMTQTEVDFYNAIAQRYQEDNKFANISDLLELDRLLRLEISCFRWDHWNLTGTDYKGQPAMSNLQKNIQDASKEIREIKGGLGIDKKTRDKEKGDTIAAFFDNLRLRAKEFGIHRDEQNARSITILKELQAKITLYKNSTNTERTEFNCHLDDIIQWCEEMFVEFDEIDRHYRENNQKYWIREFNY